MDRRRPPVWVSLGTVQVRVDGRCYPADVQVRKPAGGEYSRADKDAVTAHVLLVMGELGYRLSGLEIRDSLWSEH